MTLVDRYIYTVGGTTGFVYNMDVHRFDLTTCTWELVEPKSQYTPEPRLVTFNIESAFVANLRLFAIKKYWVFICIFGLLECFPLSYMSRDVRKPDFCIWGNKDADQLRGNREADQRLCFRLTDSTTHLHLKTEISNI